MGKKVLSCLNKANILPVVFLFFSIEIIASCFLFAPLVSSEVIDKVIAVVNDSVITLSELNEAVNMAVTGGFGTGLKKKIDVSLRSRVLDSLIEKTLVEQASVRAGVSVRETEIDRAIEQVKKRNNLSQSQLLIALANDGLTYKEYRGKLRDQIRQAKFTDRAFRYNVVISDEDINNYYKQNSDTFYEPVLYRLAIISFLDKKTGIAERKAKMVLKKLKKGVSFESLAKRYSEGPNSSGGGDLGYLETGEMEKRIGGVVKHLKKGESSGLITTNTEIHIIKLLDRRDRVAKPLSSVSQEIYSILFQSVVKERYREWLENMKRTAHIEIRM